MQPIEIPEDWTDTGLLTFEEFCDLIKVPRGAARGWRRRRVGPHWCHIEDRGRLYITVAEARRFLRAANPPHPAPRTPHPASNLAGQTADDRAAAAPSASASTNSSPHCAASPRPGGEHKADTAREISPEAIARTPPPRLSK